MTFARFLFLTIMLFGCRPKIPDNIIQPEKMQAVFWDYIQIENYVRLYVAEDSTKSAGDSSAALLAGLYKKHKITREDFNRSLKYYTAHEEDMRKLLDTLTVRANRQPDSATLKRLLQ